MTTESLNGLSDPEDPDMEVPYRARHLGSTIPLIHGRNDEIVPVEQSESLHEALSASGWPTSLTLFDTNQAGVIGCRLSSSIPGAALYVRAISPHAILSGWTRTVYSAPRSMRARLPD